MMASFEAEFAQDYLALSSRQSIQRPVLGSGRWGEDGTQFRDSPPC